MKKSMTLIKKNSINNRVKILVTGSNGLVGSNIINALSQSGAYLTGLSRNANSVISCCDYYSVDLLEKEKLPRDIECDIFVHCAAMICSDNRKKGIIENNCLATLNAIKYAESIGARSFIYISSAPIIGKPLSLPISEEHEDNPLSLYHASKLFGEKIVEFASSQTIKTYSLRIPSPLGLHMSLDSLVPIWLDRARKNLPIKVYGKGLRRQSYLDLRDLANIIIGLEQSKPKSGMYIVSPERSISNIELLEIILGVTKSKSKIVFVDDENADDDLSWHYNNDKIKKAMPDFYFTKIEDTIKYMYNGN